MCTKASYAKLLLGLIIIQSQTLCNVLVTYCILVKGNIYSEENRYLTENNLPDLKRLHEDK